MSKYINYDAIDYRNDRLHDKSSDFIDGVIYMAQRIEDAPSIDLADYVHKDFHDKTCEAMAKRHTEEISDMVSVVRCKECKHREKYPCNEITFYECSHLRLYGTKVGVEDDWFCADGEREGE